MLWSEPGRVEELVVLDTGGGICFSMSFCLRISSRNLLLYSGVLVRSFGESVDSFSSLMTSSLGSLVFELVGSGSSVDLGPGLSCASSVWRSASVQFSAGFSPEGICGGFRFGWTWYEWRLRDELGSSHFAMKEKALRLTRESWLLWGECSLEGFWEVWSLSMELVVL